MGLLLVYYNDFYLNRDRDYRSNETHVIRKTGEEDIKESKK